MPDVDLSKLRPGDRVMVRDWRNENLYTGTVVAHRRANTGARFADGGQRKPRDLVSVQRDHFVGDRAFQGKDVHEVLPSTEPDRARRLAELIGVEGARCTACLEYAGALATECRHVIDCGGPILIYALEGILHGREP